MRTKMQERVRYFMEQAGQTVNDKYTEPTEEQRKLAARLILEEAVETVTALGFFPVTMKPGEQATVVPIRVGTERPRPIKPLDIVEVIDGLCDTEYVLKWTWNLLGLNDEKYLDEVCDNNDLKVVDPQFDEDGKLMKPANHPKPDIASLFANDL